MASFSTATMKTFEINLLGNKHVNLSNIQILIFIDVNVLFSFEENICG